MGARSTSQQGPPSAQSCKNRTHLKGRPPVASALHSSRAAGDMLRRVLATVREPRFRLSLGAGFGVVTVLLAILGLVTYWNTSRLIEASRLVEHARDVIGQLEVLFSSLKDAEAGQRGYVITGLPSYLEPYKSAVATVRPTLDQIGRLTADNPAQHERALRLVGLVSEKVAQLQNTIDLRDRAGIEAAAAGIATGTEKATMEQIRAVIGQMQAEERRLLQTRSADTTTTARTAIVTLSLGTALLFTFLGLIWALLRLDLLKRRAAEEELRQSEAELRTTLRSIGDAVIATDRTGRVTFVNPVAERLTGWPEAEAAGRDAREVFRIVHELTRAEVESPILRALREGATVDLANHTILISRDGTERPIADRDAAGRARSAASGVHRVVFERRNRGRSPGRQGHGLERRRRKALRILRGGNDRQNDRPAGAARAERKHGEDSRAHPERRASPAVRYHAGAKERTDRGRFRVLVPDPRRRGDDRRSLEDRPGHHQAERGGTGAPGERRGIPHPLGRRDVARVGVQRAGRGRVLEPPLVRIHWFECGRISGQRLVEGDPSR